MSTPTPTQSAPIKPSPTSTTKPNRLPAPTLFVGPPSRNASQLSVSRQLLDPNKPQRDPLIRQRSALSRPFNAEPETDTKDHANGAGASSSGNANRLRKASERSVDVRWREMQSTLNEVELTAQSSTHIFGASHAQALDRLRTAQVELARAWGRGSEENGLNTDNIVPEMDTERFQGAASLAEERAETTGTRKRGDTDASVSTILSDSSVRSDDTVRSGRSQLEDDTKEDIKRASERRGQNERYFQMVEKSVRDVVEKLEVVAEAMRGVEGESRSLWSGSSRSSDQQEREGGGNGKGASAVDGVK